MDHALAAEEAAEALASDDRMNDALPLFEMALETYEGVGAARDIARATATLRRFGIRRGSHRPRARPASGWDSLTPTEQQAVRLVASGLSNAEIAKQMFIPATRSRHTSSTCTRSWGSRPAQSWRWKPPDEKQRGCPNYGRSNVRELAQAIAVSPRSSTHATAVLLSWLLSITVRASLTRLTMR